MTPVRFKQFLVRLAILGAIGLLIALVVVKAVLWVVPLITCPGFRIEGFGKDTKGGCGGTTLYVTNLNDRGPGSLREILDKKDADGKPQKRMVKFKVTGTIELDSNLTLADPFVTIDGSDVPAGGVSIKGGKLHIQTDEVIVRHLRVRPGPDVPEPKSGDGVMIDRGARNVVLDHVSISWATDENLDLFTSRRVTVQWSIIAEGLHCATHPEGCHSKGVFISYGDERSTLSFHHNLLAFNADRNPLIEHGKVDFVNNVIYHRTQTDVVPERFGPLYVNLVANYYLNDASRSKREYEINLKGGAHAEASSVFLEGNVVHDLDEVLRPARVLESARGVPKIPRLAVRHRFPRVRTTDANRAYEEVLAKVGATLPCRDATDARVIQAVRLRSGSYIDSPEEVGGWPDLAQGCP